MVSIHNSNPILALREAAQEVIADLLARHQRRISAKRLVVHIDVEDLCSSLDNNAQLLKQFDSTLRSAIDDCVEQGEVSITVMDTPRGIEIEVSDSDSNSSAISNEEVQLQTATFYRHRLPNSRLPKSGRWGAASSDLQVLCDRCPQGGLAWTIVAGKLMTAKRAA